MTTETTSLAAVPPIGMTDRGFEALQRFERERACYRRELGRLLHEGQAGRHALLKGDTFLGVYDTWADANQAGLDRFGLDEPFYVQKIDAHDEQRFALLDAWMNARCQP